MSSAVSYAYRVREEELRRQREVREARDAFRAAERRYEQLRQQAAEQRRTWGDSIAVPEARATAELADAAALRSAAQKVQRETAAAESRLDDQVVAARIAALREGFATTMPEGRGPVSAAEAIERNREERPEPARADEEAGVAEALARVVSKLDPGAGEEAAEKVREAVEQVRRTSSASGREQGIDALRLLVQEANQEAREARAREELLDRSEARLGGFGGPEAAAVRRLLTEVRADRREIPPDLEAAVDAAIEQETRAQEAEYVADKLRGALEDLGYEVGPDFETALLDQGYTQFSRAGWPGYAVRVRTGGRPPHLNFNVVRGEATRTDQAARDREVEEEFCEGQEEVLERLAQAGIATERTRIVSPGERSLQVVEGLGERGGEASRRRDKEIGR